jgi:dienelactone hydrolase
MMAMGSYNTDIEKLTKSETLPDLFTMLDGSKVTTKNQWQKRKEELKKLFQYYEYGVLPPKLAISEAAEIFSENIFNDTVTYKIIRLTYGKKKQITAYLYLAIPKEPGLYPVVITGDRCWNSKIDSCKQLIERGYILAEFDRTCFDHDDSSRFDGLHPLYPEYDFGTLAAWAWGYQRIVDYLEKSSFVDKGKIIISGHSRGGKAALLASALDDRIALTVSNGSGQCGSAPMRTFYQSGKVETVNDISTVFPYWFNKQFLQFNNDNISFMPFDQHALIASIAPRGYLATYALDDEWANPKGTMQMHIAARKAFEFLGAGEKAGIHFRNGLHEQNEEDWDALLDFADKILFKKEIKRSFEYNPFVK